MATKKLSEDMEEVKKSLNFMSEELSKVVKQQMGLLELIDEVRQLKAVIKEKDRKIEELERRVDDLEQYTRMEDLVISGLETNHYSYARITAGDKEGEDAPRGEKLLLEQQVIKFFNDKCPVYTYTAIIRNGEIFLRLHPSFTRKRRIRL